MKEARMIVTFHNIVTKVILHLKLITKNNKRLVKRDKSNFNTYQDTYQVMKNRKTNKYTR